MPARLPVAALRVAAAAAFLAGCTSELPVPTGIKLTCDDGRCPAGYTCIDTRSPAVCIPSSSVGTVPAVASFAVAPAVARVGVEVRVTFTVSKQLGPDPTVTLDLTPPRQLTKDAAASSGDTYVYQYAPVGDEPQAQDLLVRADLEDPQGLTSRGATVGQVRFDFSTPALGAVALAGSPARGGGTLRLAFTASEPLSRDPIARVGGVPMTKDAASAGLSYVYTYVSSGTETEDPAGLAVTVDLLDLGGNAADGVVAATAVFDRTPPALAGSPLISPAAASAGTLVRATFAASEDLAGDPVVRLGTIVLDKGAQSGRAYTYSHVASPADAEGPTAASFELQDLAGNTATVSSPAAVTFDFGPPQVLGLTLCDDDGTSAPCAAPQATFSAQAGHDAVKITFALSEPGAAVVSVGTTPLTAPDGCTSTGLAFVCRHAVIDPAAGAQPRVETAGVYVQATDPAGNRSLESVFLTRDFAPPGLAGTPFLERCDAYGPARVAANDLWTKPRDSYGCEFSVSGGKGPVRVSFTLDEPVPLQPYASGVLQVTVDGVPGDFWLDPGTTSPTQFAAVMTATPTEGVHQVLADVRDPVGNTATVDLGTLRVDLTPPAAPDTLSAGRVVYQRYPWGADATGGAKEFYLRGSSNAAVPGNAVVAYDGSDRSTAAEIGRTTANIVGGFGGPPGGTAAFSISSGNVPEVFVAQEDLAGNSSAPALVLDGEWTATPGFKQAGSLAANPHVLAVDPAWRESRHAGSQEEPPNPFPLARRNQGQLDTVGAPDLRDRTPWAGTPSARGDCAAAHDGDVGRIVVHGGYSAIRAGGSYNTTWYGDTWTWNGGRWSQLETSGSPGARSGHVLVHDPVRQRTVLFGGTGATGVLRDTWELSGSRWTRVCWPGCAAGVECTCTQSPPPLGLAFWDPTAGRVVGVTQGGPSQTWAWNGQGWSQLAPVHPLPVGASRVATSPELSTSLVLVGGSGTWTWNGDDWIGPAALPAFDTSGHNFVLSEVLVFWDPAQGRYLAFDPYPGQLFAWNGAAWSAATPPAAAPFDDTFSSCGAYDREDGAYVRFGGCFNFACNVPEGGVRNTTLRLTPDSALVLTPGVQPAARTGATLADVRDEGVAWLVQGIGTGVDPYRDDWTWDGHRWTQQGSSPVNFVDVALGWLGPGRTVQYGGTPTGPSGFYGNSPFTFVRTAPGTAWTQAPLNLEPDPPGSSAQGDQAMTWDPAHGAVYFRPGAGTSTWSAVWISGPSPGVSWTAWPGASSPASLRGHRLAYCASAGGVVLFGGKNGAGTLLDQTWVWNGSAWSQVAAATRPPARANHVMFCDERRNKVYVVGGDGAAGPLDDLWQFDGTGWTELFPSQRPEGRKGAASAFLSARGRGVLFGGLGSGIFGDTWDFDGGRDRRPAHLFHASFAAAGTGPVAIGAMDVSWIADARSSFADPLPSYLADLHVRDGDRWRPAGGGNINPERLIEWSTTTDPAWTVLAPAVRAARLRNLLGGDRLDLSLAVAPHGTNDTLSPGATLTTGYVEARVSYRLSCLAAGAATTTPLRCCSSSAAGGACQ